MPFRACYILLIAAFAPGHAMAAGDADEPADPIVVTGTGLEATPASPAYDQTILKRERLTGSAW